MITVAGIEPKANPKQNQRLYVDIISVGTFDALLHGLDAFQNKQDIAEIATKFSMLYLHKQQKDKEEQQDNADQKVQYSQYSIDDLLSNYISGYLYGRHHYINASEEQQKEISGVFQKIKDRDDDTIVSSVFDAVQCAIADFAKTSQIYTVNEFCKRAAENGVSLMGAMHGDVALLALVVERSDV